MELKLRKKIKNKSKNEKLKLNMMLSNNNNNNFSMENVSKMLTKSVTNDNSIYGIKKFSNVDLNFNKTVIDEEFLDYSFTSHSSTRKLSNAFGIDSSLILTPKINKNYNFLDDSTSYDDYIHRKTIEIIDKDEADNISSNNYFESKKISKDFSTSDSCNNKRNDLYVINLNTLDSDNKTTLMIKNIPNKYNKELMLAEIEKKFKGTFDYFHLPMDYNNNCNMGYAFINFKSIRYIKDFYIEFNNKKWKKFCSEKICQIKYARIQGIDGYKRPQVINNSVINYKNY